jgi:SAM-dependent methyltransferase
VDALAVGPRVRARAEVPAMLGVGTVEVRLGPEDDPLVAGDVVEADATGRTAVPGLWVAGNVADVRAVVVGSAAAGTAVAAAVNAELVADDVARAVAALPEPGSPEFWEGFYRDRAQVWSGRPNAPLVDAVADLPPGTALDLGAGEGGDVLWLAGRGWKVLAVDVAETALARIAERAGDLPVTGERHDLAETFPDGTFDLVSAQYLHSPSDAFPRAEILRRAAAAVAPGGTLLVVGHGRLPSWAWDQHRHMPAAEAVLADLELDPAAWEVVRCASPERTATGPDGQTATITDEIVQVRRRA